MESMDLSTRYMGMTLKNPLVPSASPLSRSLDGIRELEDAGAAAIVMYSIFEEQFSHEARELAHFLSHGTESFAEALTYFPESNEFNLGPEEYLELIVKAKKGVSIPIIGSLNGYSTGGWISYAKKLEEAGVDAIELNVYYIPTDPDRPGSEIENVYIDILKTVKKSVKVPVAMKMSPYFSSFANMAKRLDEAGADALVLFNRFYQPDIDLEKLEVVPNVTLSTSNSLRLPLRWIAILYGHIKADLAATSGIHSADDVLKMLMGGASVTMLCSSLLKMGPRHLTAILSNLKQWMEEHEYVSVTQMRGSMSQKSVAEPAAFERANYMKAINRYRR
jgi:dihydroorotate dehydrogenase (fumarate)